MIGLRLTKQHKRDRVYLYNYGDECTNITGGWNVSGQSNASVTKNTNNMYFKCGNGSNWIDSWYTIVTVNSINISKYNNLCVYINITNSSNYANSSRFGICDSTANTYASKYDFSTEGTVEKLLKLDISNISGNYNIGLAAGNNMYFYIYSIYLL